MNGNRQSMSIDGSMNLRPVAATPDERMVGDFLIPRLVEKNGWPATICERDDIVRTIVDEDVQLMFVLALAASVNH